MPFPKHWAALPLFLFLLGQCLAANTTDPSPPNSTDLPALRGSRFNRPSVKPKGDGFLRMPVRRHRFNGTGPRRRPDRMRRPSGQGQDKRGWGWSHLDDYEGLAYLIPIEIGTPPQKVMVTVDTGSYELWVNPYCAHSVDPVLCRSYGQYAPKKSSSSYLIGGHFQIQYGTGSAVGKYYGDTMKVAMFQVRDVQFAVADDSQYTYSGVMGLGYGYGFTTTYPTLIGMMWGLDLIAAPIFSMGLGGEGDGFSEIIFGGVNRWKFTGYLEPVSIWPPIDQQDPGWIQYWVNITSIGITAPSGSTTTLTDGSFNMAMLLDSGSTLSYLREDIVSIVAQQLRARVDASGNYWVDCALRRQAGSVNFGFNHGRMVVSVSYRDFIWEQYPDHCLMGVQPADVGSTNYVLGDTFIRGAYLVFDQQSDVVWVGDYYNCGDGVVTVGLRSADTQFIRGAC